MTPKVTIVTPSYNQADYLAETIESVLAQDYADVEYFVVDDGSTDRSVEIAQRYADRLTFVQQPNAGQVAALNNGFRRGSGELLGWINSDDVLLPDAVSTVVAAFEKTPDALLIYGDNVFVDEDGNEIGPAKGEPLDVERSITRCENRIPQPGSLFRRRALDIAPLNERGYYFFDFEFAIRLAAVGEVRHIARPLALYRIHSRSKTVADPSRKAGDYVRVADEFFAAPDFPEPFRPHARAGRASAYLAAAEFAYAGGDLSASRRHFVRGLALSRGRVPLRSLGIAAKALLPAALVARLRSRR